MPLPIADGYVVQDRVARNSVLGLALTRMFQNSAHVKGELDLPIRLFGDRRQDDILAGAYQSRRPLVKECWKARDFSVLFFDVGAVVLPDAQDFGWGKDRRRQY